MCRSILSVRKMLTAAAAVAGTLAFVAPAQAATAAPERVCGFWEDHQYAFYNHCGDSRILIRINQHGGRRP
ncbi:hypothetical protein DMH04_13800 [Kibdelosporangium aridum]|uniref:Uncharacterized protein n=2 Tax=Kibdelosporangium aridum TaxID=2030 RepID=A0A428ZDY2_KIBAR|nr:hypothetical protein DMH04_13800 [Kibdelosporangium aridum]